MIEYVSKENIYNYKKKLAKSIRDYIDSFYDNDFFSNYKMQV